MIPAFDLLVLSQIPNIGSNRLRMLAAHFEDYNKIYTSSPREFVKVEGIHKKIASQISHFLKSDDLDLAKKHAEKQLSMINKIGGGIITYWDKNYPDLLKKIYDPPVFLFLRGGFDPSDRYSLAIVGTRTPSPYGTGIAEKFSRELSSTGITIASGLARGIDTTAHDSALKAGGRTVAVLGSGVDVIYPPENRGLVDRIIESGAVISECEMGAKPDAMNFPRRNRIVSGLSLGTIIVETTTNGGAMITATTALDQDREVFAVPGQANGKKISGCNQLIKTGRAKLVETIDDVISELEVKLRPVLKGSHAVPVKPPPALSLFEKSIYDLLIDNPQHIDAISEQAKLSTADTLVNLLNLEFKGIVRQMPGKMFVRVE